MIFATGLTLFAAEVSQQEAMEKASAFMQQRKGSTTAMRRAQLPLNMQQAEAGSQLLYAFNIEGGGFVIASGDDRTIPILGYSLTGSIDADCMPDNMRSWLQSYADDIRRLSKSYTAPQTSEGIQLAPIMPLLQTTWYQVAPYDLMTPVYDGEEKPSWKGKHSATGCVATAMAQVMYYHRWPQDATTTIPSYTFQYADDKNTYESCTLAELPPTTLKWDQMLPSYTDGQPGTEEQRMAVAELMRYCGQAVKMTYTPAASGTQHEFIVNALRRYFGYSKAMQSVNRAHYTIEGWKQLIWNELDHRRPVVFGGMSSSGGHEFVIDGYDGNGMFHVNWGWAGMNDGYFAVNVLNPNDNTSVGAASSTDLGYATNQQIILGLEKSTGQEVEVPEVVKQLIIYNELITVDTIMAYQTACVDFDQKETSYYMGLGIKNDDGTCTPVLQNDTVTKFSNGMIAPQIYKTQQLTSLTDGSYALYPIAREAGDATQAWNIFAAPKQCFRVDVKNGKAAVRPTMKMKIVNAYFEKEPTPLEDNTLVLVVENQSEEEVSTVTKLKVGKTSGKYFISALDINKTMRPTELLPGERTTLRYSMTIPCQGDLEINLQDYSTLTTLDHTQVTVKNSPHFYDLQMIDYKIEYLDNRTLEAEFYIKNNDTRTWQRPYSIIMLADMEGAETPAKGISYDPIPTGQDLKLFPLALDGILHKVDVQTDARIMVYPDYAGFFLGDFLLDVTVKMGTKVTPQGVTAIDAIRTVNCEQDSPYYDLQGRRVNGKPAKGVYIKNGKIIRLSSHSQL